MVKTLRLTLAQLNPIVGDIDGNTNKLLKTWEHHDDETDLLLLPELFLSGYPPEDLVLNTEFMNDIHAAIEHICTKSKSFNSAALVTTPWPSEHERPYNAALLIENGKIQHVIYKRFLPNYGVFDEIRTFQPQKDIQDPINFRGHKLGVMICEDMWFADIPLHMAKCGAEILIIPNASPYDTFKQQERDFVANRCIQDTGLSVVYLNMVGGQDEVVFDGASFVKHHNGNVTHAMPFFKEAVHSIKISDQDNEPFIEPLHQYEDIPPNTIMNDYTYDALCLATRDYVRKNGFKNVILGLSGGIDSALVAAIAVDALGAEHVRCVMLPSEFTSEESLSDAKECAEMLGVSYDIIPIKDALKTFETLIPDLQGLAHENTQSRLRGVILMALSNMSGAMLLTTGNKSEMAVGYCTIYGDMNGGFNPLKDVYKTDVYAYAQERNQRSITIPQNIIDKAPSAELREEQTDQDSLPPYDVLDDILKVLVECDDVDWHALEPGDYLDMYKRVQQHPEDTAHIAKLLKISEYKRFQSPPGPKVTRKAFGRERRYPMTNGFVNKIAKA